MKTLKYTNANKAINVEYLTDLIGDNEEFTTYQIKQIVNGVEQLGLNGTAVAFGMEDEINAFSLAYMKTMATNKNLSLEVHEDGKSIVTLNTLTALAMTTSAIDAGVAGVAQLEVLTFPATAAATQGDYVVLTNALSGKTAAVWLDIDAAGTAPTGALYTAADYKIQAGIATGDGAIQVAAKVVAAIELVTAWVSEVTLTDNLSGTVDVQQNYTGNVADAVPKNANDSGVGSITSSTTNNGTDGTPYTFTFVAAGGNTPYVWTTASTLPVGVTLSTAGVLSGTPRQTNTYSLTVVVTDQFGITDSLTADYVVTAV